jgi:voltage-gated sodium channel
MEEKSTRAEPGRAISLVRSVVASRAFDWGITGVILLQAAALAVEATPELYMLGDRRAVVQMTSAIHTAVVGIFIVEAGMRIASLYPRPQDYFRDGWNDFDFAVIVLSLLPITGQFSTIARLFRLLRVTRLVTKSRELHVIVNTLIRSIPSIFNILILLGVLFFIYAVIGFHLFRGADPEHWSSFTVSLTTLFQIMTLEGWVNVMQPAIAELGPLYWLYFASFILIGTFIVINLFISVIVRKSEEAYRQVQRESAMPMTQREIMEEIREIRRILEDLERRIGRDASSAGATA